MEYDGSLVWVAVGYHYLYTPATMLIYSTNGGVDWTAAANSGDDTIDLHCVTYDSKSGRFVASG